MGPYGSSAAPYEFCLRVRGPYSFNAYIMSLRAPYGFRDHKQPVNHPCGDRTGPYGPRTATFDARAGFCKLRLCQFPNVSLWLFWYTYKKFGDRLHKCSVSDILFFFFFLPQMNITVPPKQCKVWLAVYIACIILMFESKTIPKHMPFISLSESTEAIQLVDVNAFHTKCSEVINSMLYVK